MAETMSVPSTREERFAFVRQFVAERLFLKPEKVQSHSRLIADLGADSLDFVDLQFHLERLFDIRFQEGEFFDFTFHWVTPEGYLPPAVVERTADVVRVRRAQVDLAPGEASLLEALRAAAIADDDRIYARAVEHVLRAFDPGAGPLPPPPLAAQIEQPGMVAFLALRGTRPRRSGRNE